MPKVIKIERTGREGEPDDYSWDSITDSIGQQRTSRYRKDDIIVDEQRNVIYRETYSKPLRSRAGSKYFKVTPQYEYRPDLLAEDVYGSPKYWYVILEMNGLTGFEQFVRGLTVIVPDREGVIAGA